VKSAALFDGVSFDQAPCIEDFLASSEVDIGRGEIVQALMMTSVVVVFDEGCDSALQITG
jgi:hypothetical protein